MHPTSRSIFRNAKNAVLLSAFASITMAMPLVASAQDDIPKLLLIKMARENAGVLCKSDVFTDCMGFTAVRCDELKEEAIDTCLGPLPDNINLEELQNESLEACPKTVYREAGFAEEKAKLCFDKAMEATPAPTEPTEQPAPSEPEAPATD
ncbi:MAG: hypothetical protein V3U65_12310 [Granulosicoccaceae bacterium]